MKTPIELAAACGISVGKKDGGPYPTEQQLEAFAAKVIAQYEAQKRDAQPPVNEKLLAALEDARNSLIWYQDWYPEANDEAMARIDTAIANAKAGGAV